MRCATAAPPQWSKGTARTRTTHACSLVAALVALTLGGSTTSIASDPKPAPTLATVPRVPVVSAQGPATRVEGKITRSSRGRKGPVRVLVERASGAPVTVLFAADDVCDRLGLSLKTGEQVVVEGSMLKGERPILIATAVTVDGKQVRVRDAEGKVIDPAAPSAASTGGGDKPAVVGGGKPSPATSPVP